MAKDSKRAEGYAHLTDKQYKMLGGASVHHIAGAKSKALRKKMGDVKAEHGGYMGETGKVMPFKKK